MFTEASRKSQFQVSWQETGFKLRTTNVKVQNATVFQAELSAEQSGLRQKKKLLQIT
jgi:hypothetical protein